MVDLGGLANYFNRVGGSFDYFSPLELGISSLVGEISSFIDPTPFVSPFSYGLPAGIGISRSFYGSLFSPTYEQSKWQATGIIGTMGDAVIDTDLRNFSSFWDRMMYGAQTATGGGAPFHFITPMPVPYIPVSAPSSPDPSFFDRPMQRYDPPAASPTPPSAQPPPSLDLPLTPPPNVPAAKKVGQKKGAPPASKGQPPKIAIKVNPQDTHSVSVIPLADERNKKLATVLEGGKIYQFPQPTEEGVVLVRLLVKDNGDAYLIKQESAEIYSAREKVGTVKNGRFTPEK